MPDHNLPVYLSRFFGRDQELAELQAVLNTARLLTLTGPGGAGKTRLSVHLGAAVSDTFEHGVWQIQLAGVADPGLVLLTVAGVLGVEEPQPQRLMSALTDYLRRRRMLLLLDNCEHLVQACAALADTLLRACPNLQILATSREPLGVDGEVRWPVPSLQPEHGALELFADRARAVLPGFALTEQNIPTVVEICRRLDGLPLAVELAASKLRVLSVEEVSARLHDRFRLLAGGSRTALPRQQTLRAVFDWSHDHLPEPQQVLWRRLAVFVGGLTLEAAECVCGTDPLERSEVLPLLEQLVDKSVVQAFPGTSPVGTRYRLLETLREYGQERLATSGEEMRIRHRHCLYFRDLAEKLAQERPREPDFVGVRTEEEEPNLRSAMDWAAVSDHLTALQMVEWLSRYWYARGRPGEGRQRVLSVLALPAAAEHPDLRGYLLNHAASFAIQMGDLGSAAREIGEALGIGRQTGNPDVLSRALLTAGTVALEQGSLAESMRLNQESLTLTRQLGNLHGERIVLMHLCRAALHALDFDEAERLAREGLRIPGTVHQVPRFLFTLGEAAIWRGDLETARAVLEQALEKSPVDKDPTAWTLGSILLARVELLQEQPDRALELLRQSLGNMRGDFRRHLAQCLEVLGPAYGAKGRPDRAARVFGATAGFYRMAGTTTFPYLAAWYGEWIERVRAELGEQTFQELWADGERMTPGDMIEYGLAVLPTRQVPAAAPPGPAGLTERELEVTKLVAAGLTDREIAGRLYISRRTVDAHLRHIFNKANVPTRAALATWAVRNGLI